MPKSTSRAKVSKPYPDFPLTPMRATKGWAMKIRGRLYYFGPLDDWRAALDRYNAVKGDLYAGRAPRPKADGITLVDLANRFLISKRSQLQAIVPEITARTFADYHATCQRLLEAFGKSRLVVDLTAEGFAATGVNGARIVQRLSGRSKGAIYAT